MRKHITLLATLAVCGMFASAAGAASFTIDHFSEPSAGQMITLTGTGSVSSTTTGLAGVVGNARTMQINVVSSVYGNSTSFDVNVVGDGTLSLNNGSGQNGAGTVTWDANGAGLGGLAGVDLTNGGTLSHLQAHILGSDLNLGFSVSITETAAMGGSTANWSTSLGSGVSFVNQALSSFTNSANVDFTHVSKIALTMSGPLDQDATLDLLEVTNTPVPEPITMTIMGIGGLAMLLRRRRVTSPG